MSAETMPLGGADAVTIGGDIGESVGTWGGRFVGGAIGELFGPEAVPLGAYVGGKVGGFAGRAAGSYLASHMSNASEKADGSSSEKVCLPCLRKPNRRHNPCKTKGNDPTKKMNTMIDPGHADSVNDDIAKIQNGSVPQENGKFSVGGRTYGVDNQSLYPESGPGLVNVSRGSHQLLKQLNTNGYDAAMNFAKQNPSISEDDIDKALELWKKCGKDDPTS